jgi:hypothetical protein
MWWKITCYNGTIWESNRTELLSDAIKRFKNDTGLHDCDIKFVKNLT